MNVTITYRLASKHTLTINAGDVRTTPALPTSSRIYVVQNLTTAYKYYIGTAANVRDRFTERLIACRVWGFDQGEADAITIWVFQIVTKVGARGAEVYATPGNTGVSTTAAGDVDVEWLLVRTFTEELGKNVRNVTKTGPFLNPFGGYDLVWTIDKNGIAGCDFVPDDNNFYLARGGTL